MSPILKNNVHEMSPFESVHEKSPILKNSVHEMSLSTKCLHPIHILANQIGYQSYYFFKAVLLAHKTTRRYGKSENFM